MKNFDPFFQKALEKRSEKNICRMLQLIDPQEAMYILYRGNKVVNFSSNDYLGLSRHPYLKETSCDWIERFGVGCASSRLVTGNYSFYKEMETKLAYFLGTEATLIFPSGWQANVSVLASLLEHFPKPVYLFTDRLNHASLHYGCKIAQTRQIRFRHNDMEHLKACLNQCQDSNGSRIIVTETLFSMDGDRSDLAQLRQIADEFNAFLFLDDAHGTGVFGDHGQGLAPQYADLTMGTFSKAWGSFGSYVAGSKVLCDWLVNFCSGLIHTTALPPGVMGAISASLDLLPTLDQERHYLIEQIKHVRSCFINWGFNIGKSNSQIIPLIIGDSKKAIRIAKQLEDHGLLGMPIRPPTVPINSSRLRLTLSAAHREADIGHLLDVIYSLRHELHCEEANL